jgi:WD40 repeat protein
VLISAD